MAYRSIEREPDPLDLLAQSALRSLQQRVARIEYPDDLCRTDAILRWKEFHPRIEAQNPGFLQAVEGRSGVYAILTAMSGQPWRLQYIGQSEARGTRQRIRSHLIWRNKETPSGKYTGSKFDSVTEAVMAGAHVGFSFVAIEPGSLRHYVEHQLIVQCSPPWNIHGASGRAGEAGAAEPWKRN